MSNLAVDELRSHLRSHLSSLQSGASASEIVTAFRAKYPHTIAKASRALEDIGLIKLLNEVGTRLPLRVEEQPELFAGYSIPTSIFIHSGDRENRGVHTPIAKARICDVEAWIETHGKPRLTRSAKVIEMQRLIRDVKPFAPGENTTLAEAMHAAKLCECEPRYKTFSSTQNC